jgi:hypothetical protein
MNHTEPASATTILRTIPACILCMGLMALTAPILKASVAGEVVERLARMSGHFTDDAGRISAREAMEVAMAKHGKEVVEMAERGGFGLAEAAVRHGDDVWRLAKLSAEAPSAIAARGESIMVIARRLGDDAALLEIKAPACGAVLAGRLPAAALNEIANRAAPHEISRMAAMALHQSPAELNAAFSIWKRGGGRALEFLTPGRIAASGFAMAAIIAAWHAPDALIPIIGVALNGLLGPIFAFASWALLLATLIFLQQPLLWLVCRGAALVKRARQAANQTRAEQA